MFIFSTSLDFSLEITTIFLNIDSTTIQLDLSAFMSNLGVKRPKLGLHISKLQENVKNTRTSKIKIYNLMKNLLNSIVTKTVSPFYDIYVCSTTGEVLLFLALVTCTDRRWTRFSIRSLAKGLALKVPYFRTSFGCIVVLNVV